MVGQKYAKAQELQLPSVLIILLIVTSNKACRGHSELFPALLHLKQLFTL